MPPFHQPGILPKHQPGWVFFEPLPAGEGLGAGIDRLNQGSALPLEWFRVEIRLCLPQKRIALT